ncbi:MAG: alpha/beta hydrolase [Roseinatronobacter sp.]
MLPRAETGSWYAARASDPLTGGTFVAQSMSLDRLLADIDAAKARAPHAPILLAGFSQGACLSLELLSRERPIVAACAAFTGCCVGVAGDVRPAADLQGFPVLLTGSDADPWISIKAWSEAAADLSSQGARLRREVYPERTHEVCDSVIGLLQGVLKRLIAVIPP